MADVTIRPVTDRTPELVAQLAGVWERSVRATHAFLTEEGIGQIAPFVPQAVAGVGALVVAELTVNEQNPQAVGFYEHLGFSAYKRTETDEEGRPYPLLYMRL